MNKIFDPELLHKVSKNYIIRLRTSRMNFGVRREEIWELSGKRE